MKTFRLMGAAMFLLGQASFASIITYTTVLTGPNENPPNASPGIGFGIVLFDNVANTLEVKLTFSGLTTGTTASHIHCCAPLGANAGVATTVPAFPGFPLGVTSGSYQSVVFDLTLPTIYNPAFVAAQGGLPQAEASLINGIENGLTYLNIHTVNFPGGEIRSQLFSAAAPEPASLVLLGSALIGFGMIRRRNRVPFRSTC